MPERPVPPPDRVRVQREPTGGWSSPGPAARVELTPVGSGLRVDVTAAELSRVALRWRRPVPEGVLVLGDAWERGYGDLQWQGVRPERVLPWTVLVHDPATGVTVGAGVEVRGGAFAFWTVDADGVNLVLDVRSGGAAVALGGRTLTAAVVRAVTGEPTPWATQRALAVLQCPDPELPATPVVGANNWYYAYGRGVDAAAVVRDARTVAELVGDHPVRPFGVVDDGWSPDGVADGRPGSGGPWDAGRRPGFPDMPGLAAAIIAEGVRPGIWYRPLLVRSRPARGLRAPRYGAFALDPTAPGVLDVVAEDVARLRTWGFELIKHDFSTYDLLGRWGPDMGPSPAGDNPPLADPTITTAEALVGLYTVIRRAAGDGLVLGCDVVGHLAAGLVAAQRAGDDTSGRVWAKTRRSGVNTLAFRIAQHGTFFAVDADCVASTPQTDWTYQRQFLDLVARSGTVLFVSVDPASRTDAVDADLAAALRLALDGGTPGGVEPLDWLSTTVPRRWRCGGEEVRYAWMDEAGGDPFEAARPSPFTF